MSEAEKPAPGKLESEKTASEKPASSNPAGNTKGKASKKRYGAPFGNTNANRFGLTLPGFPEKMMALQRRAMEYRRQLEESYAKANGITIEEIPPLAAEYIQAAVTQFSLGIKLARYERDDFGKLTFDQKVTISQRLADAAMKRVRLVKMLGLDKAERPGTGADLYDVDLGDEDGDGLED